MVHILTTSFLVDERPRVTSFTRLKLRRLRCFNPLRCLGPAAEGVPEPSNKRVDVAVRGGMLVLSLPLLWWRFTAIDESRLDLFNEHVTITSRHLGPSSVEGCWTRCRPVMLYISTGDDRENKNSRWSSLSED